MQARLFLLLCKIITTQLWILLVSETSKQAPVIFDGVSTEKGSVIGVFRDPETIIWFVVKVEEKWIPVEFDEFPVRDILFVYKAVREAE